LKRHVHNILQKTRDPSFATAVQRLLRESM
jgi:hypothetical protein